MAHLNEEQLILYHYSEVADRRTIAEHLDQCDSCRASYQSLQRVLVAVDAIPVPERSEAYGSEVWQRLHPQLPKRTTFNWASLFPMRGWVAAAAMASLLVAAFLTGRFWQRPPTPLNQAIPVEVQGRILLFEVGDHLERSQMALTELVNTEASGTVDISAEQAVAGDLVAANRIYRQTAEGSGETGVANVLDELERVLLEISHSPSKISAGELDEIRQRIETEGILFKVRVLGSQVRLRERQTARDMGRTNL